MKLTKQILGAYIGAQVKATTESGEFIGKIHSICHDIISIATGIEGAVPNITSEWFYFDQCQLILTPLSAISDEDALEVARIIYNKEFPTSAWKLNRNNYPDFVAFENKDDDDYSIFFSSATEDPRDPCIEAFMPNNQHTTMFVVADYLRSKNYDLGHLEIKSLIEAGVAVDSTSLN
jgi:hypothetical protein